MQKISQKNIKIFFLSIIMTFAFSVFVPKVYADSTLEIYPNTTGMWYNSARTVYKYWNDNPRNYACMANGADYDFSSYVGDASLQCIINTDTNPLVPGNNLATSSATMTVYVDNGVYSNFRFGDGGYIHNDATTYVNYTGGSSPILGCMDSTATNYDSTATEDTSPSSCIFPEVVPDTTLTDSEKITGFSLLSFLWISVFLLTAFAVKKLF